MKKEMRIIVTGGGSGGHTMPALSMVETIKKYCKEQDMGFELLYIGSNEGIEKKLAQKEGLDYRGISTGKLRRYFSWQNFTDIFRIIAGFFQSLAIIRRFKPDLLFSTGGFVSVPPVVAARFLRKAVIIHEQTIDAGLANKLASKFADKVALTFEESKKYFPPKKVVVTGIPMRDKIFQGKKESAFERFGLNGDLPTIYFSGGGLGCHLLNVVSKEVIPQLLDKANIIFQTGHINEGADYLDMLKFREGLEESKKGSFVIYKFINDEIGDLFSVADLAIARSGAGTVNELIALKIPAIFVPLAIAANNEQLKNAKIMKSLGGAEIIEEKDLTAVTLMHFIKELLYEGKAVEMKKELQNIEDFQGNNSLLELILSHIS